MFGRLAGMHPQLGAGQGEDQPALPASTWQPKASRRVLRRASASLLTTRPVQPVAPLLGLLVPRLSSGPAGFPGRSLFLAGPAEPPL